MDGSKEHGNFLAVDHGGDELLRLWQIQLGRRRETKKWLG
jgi:hypothetical protein